MASQSWQRERRADKSNRGARRVRSAAGAATKRSIAARVQQQKTLEHEDTKTRRTPLLTRRVPRMRLGPAEFAEKSFQKRLNTKDTKDTREREEARDRRPAQPAFRRRRKGRRNHKPPVLWFVLRRPFFRRGPRSGPGRARISACSASSAVERRDRLSRVFVLSCSPLV